ncbi:hypothetical protein J1605_018270 [Eschrichtius robustus]|uniref:Melanoma associated antigen N-terminal domain-containing protein n=1 Tax=Eschrichtius robustus TaxID=9764 RepID=A0AB34HVT5_ESCRO|nr:hypothetical protein J1605_018270 [Eschrichtius robustus]
MLGRGDPAWEDGIGASREHICSAAGGAPEPPGVKVSHSQQRELSQALQGVKVETEPTAIVPAQMDPTAFACPLLAGDRPPRRSAPVRPEGTPPGEPCPWSPPVTPAQTPVGGPTPVIRPLVEMSELRQPEADLQAPVQAQGPVEAQLFGAEGEEAASPSPSSSSSSYPVLFQVTLEEGTDAGEPSPPQSPSPTAMAATPPLQEPPQILEGSERWQTPRDPGGSEGGERLEGLWAGGIRARKPRAGAAGRGWERQALDVTRACACPTEGSRDPAEKDPHGATQTHCRGLAGTWEGGGPGRRQLLRDPGGEGGPEEGGSRQGHTGGPAQGGPSLRAPSEEPPTASTEIRSLRGHVPTGGTDLKECSVSHFRSTKTREQARI